MSNESSVLLVTTDETDKRVTGTVALVDSTGASLFTATGMVLNGDTRFYSGAGAPVDYTDGSPAATGEAEAGIGSIYADVTNGKLYINGGTKAQPVWKLVTSAA
jgi:hypothetical protein